MITIIEGQPEWKPYTTSLDLVGGSSGPLVFIKAKLRTFNSNALSNKITDDYDKSGQSEIDFPAIDMGLIRNKLPVIAHMVANTIEGDSVDVIAYYKENL